MGSGCRLPRGPPCGRCPLCRCLCPPSQLFCKAFLTPRKEPSSPSAFGLRFPPCKGLFPVVSPERRVPEASGAVQLGRERGRWTRALQTRRGGCSRWRPGDAASPSRSLSTFRPWLPGTRALGARGPARLLTRTQPPGRPRGPFGLSRNLTSSPGGRGKGLKETDDSGTRGAGGPPAWPALPPLPAVSRATLWPRIGSVLRY